MAGPERHDEVAPSDALADLRTRLKDAEGYLGIAGLRARRRELEEEAGRPDLWDDQDHARAVTTELGRVSSDLDGFDALDGLDASVRIAVVSSEGPSELGERADLIVGSTEAFVELLRRL